MPDNHLWSSGVFRFGFWLEQRYPRQYLREQKSQHLFRPIDAGSALSLRIQEKRCSDLGIAAMHRLGIARQSLRYDATRRSLRNSLSDKHIGRFRHLVHVDPFFPFPGIFSQPVDKVEEISILRHMMSFVGQHMASIVEVRTRYFGNCKAKRSGQEMKAKLAARV